MQNDRTDRDGVCVGEADSGGPRNHGGRDSPVERGNFEGCCSVAVYNNRSFCGSVRTVEQSTIYSLLFTIII